MNYEKEFEKLGKKIAFIRKNRGLKQVDVAEMAGISQAFLSRIESGKKQPSLTVLFALATSLRVSVSTFFKESKKSPPLPSRKMSPSQIDDFYTGAYENREIESYNAKN